MCIWITWGISQNCGFLVSLQWGLRFCISNKFLIAAAGSRTTRVPGSRLEWRFPRETEYRPQNPSSMFWQPQVYLASLLCSWYGKQPLYIGAELNLRDRVVGEVTSPRWLSGKECTCQRKRHSSISGRCPGEGNGNPLQYFCLGHPMDRGVWQSTGSQKSRTRFGN